MQPQTPTPNPQPTPPNQSFNDGVQTLIPTKNKPALFSYYCGIFGIIPFMVPLSIAAIIFGQKGLAQYRANPTPGAKTHAMIGLVLGGIQLVLFVIIAIWFLVIAARV